MWWRVHPTHCVFHRLLRPNPYHHGERVHGKSCYAQHAFTRRRSLLVLAARNLAVPGRFFALQRANTRSPRLPKGQPLRRFCGFLVRYGTLTDKSARSPMP